MPKATSKNSNVPQWTKENDHIIRHASQLKPTDSNTATIVKDKSAYPATYKKSIKQ